MGILLPENKVMGVSNKFRIIEASRENRKKVFSIPPQIVEEMISRRKISGSRKIF